MNDVFSKRLTLLRSETGKNQKETAKKLGISQSLLSHYENGKRECGLDFLIKAADYYGVSCDYILGRTTVRKKIRKKSRQSALNYETKEKNNEITDSLSICYSLIGKTKSKSLMNAFTMFLELTIYKFYRTLYNKNKDNDQNLFAVDKNSFSDYTGSALSQVYAEISDMVKNDIEAPDMSSKILAQEYETAYNGLDRSISESESYISGFIKK